MKNKKNGRAAKLFEQTQTSCTNQIYFGFSLMRKISTRIRWGTHRYNRWLALSSQDVQIVLKIKHPVHIVVFGVVTSDGDVILPFIFLHGLRFNTLTYIMYLEAVVLPWNERMAAGRSYVWQQDFAMPYKQENPVLAIRKFLRLHHAEHLAD